MDLKVLENSENKLVFSIKGTNPVFVNTLRRVMISEVPTLAVKEVAFIKNTSALFEEILAHRLGLLPLKGDIENFTLPELCDCKEKECGKCQDIVSLNCEGPLTVYASDLKFKNDKIKPAYPKMPIVKLLKGQELEFEAVITLGQGKDHTKYTPCLAYFQGKPSIKLGKVKNSEAVFKSCPRSVFTYADKSLKIANLDACNLCNACIDVCDPEDSVIVEGSDSDFTFTIESWGQRKPKDILEASLSLLDEKISMFDSLVNKAK